MLITYLNNLNGLLEAVGKYSKDPMRSWENPSVRSRKTSVVQWEMHGPWKPETKVPNPAQLLLVL